MSGEEEIRTLLESIDERLRRLEWLAEQIALGLGVRLWPHHG